MTWEIFYAIVVVIDVVSIVNSFYRAKSGPTEKQVAKMEKNYGRTLTDEDIKNYKSTQKIGGIACATVLFVLVLTFIF